MREIILDTETTGLDPALGHKVIEIGCVEIFDRKTLGKTYQAYVNPERNVPMDSFKIHGISEEFLQDKPIFMNIAQEFLDFVGNDPLVIHNAAFDMKFLDAELKLADLPALSQNRKVIDTLLIARKQYPGAKNNLDALCARFNISTAQRTVHGALLDSELLAEVYINLMDGYEEASANKKRVMNKSKYYEARSFPATQEELKSHSEFLKQIKDPIWN